MRGIVAFVEDLSPDFALFQEVDTDGTRSWHIDETAYLSDAMTGCEFDEVFAQNYDSPYLFYPLIQPHGANQSGIVTLSRHPIASAARRELPVESGFMKLLDLDRCYSVSRIPTASGKELVLYNLHLSAYTSDGAIATEQLELLCADMLAEYEAGNYCVAGGDFNKDLLGNSPEIFGVAAGENDTWAQPIPEGTIPAGLTLVAPFDETAPTASCRTASEPYSIETTFRLTVDGFLVSDNVEVVDSAVLDAGFLYSDHNPVWMDFTLK
jgi:endonuclease/exonuclease/phosphatase family metal-dependent hydrolase